MAKQGLTSCPECGSPSVRTAQARSLFDHLLTWIGRFPFRCHNCSARFIDWPISLWDTAYAKCPRCLRMDLTIWEPKHYRTSSWQDLMLWFGGNRWRCEPCRCNFVSARPRRERYQRPGGNLETAPSDHPEPNHI